jgi:hypothetical protein
MFLRWVCPTKDRDFDIEIEIWIIKEHDQIARSVRARDNYNLRLLNFGKGLTWSDAAYYDIVHVIISGIE